MAQVGNRIRKQAELAANKTSILEWNEGNHFKDSEILAAKGFAWRINKLRTTNV